MEEQYPADLKQKIVQNLTRQEDLNEEYGEDGLEQFDENDDRFSQEVYQLNQNDSSWFLPNS